ncbi:MAG: hypothetical protein GY856_19525 [bacterium]|nr:hypothetical protein [bacterium]
MALAGASLRISSYQLAIENASEGVVITRPVEANPVQVENRLIQPGGKISITELPVKILLSNGEMILQLERFST